MTDTSKTKWKVKFPQERVEKKFKEFLKSRPDGTAAYEKYEADVSTDPYSHGKPGTIARVKEVGSYPENTLRWKKGDIRIVYHADDSTETVWNLDIDTAGGITYKKKSRK